jgi:hypothetical protein
MKSCSDEISLFLWVFVVQFQVFDDNVMKKEVFLSVEQQDGPETKIIQDGLEKRKWCWGPLDWILLGKSLDFCGKLED